jgi:hypothetical protein
MQNIIYSLKYCHAAWQAAQYVIATDPAQILHGTLRSVAYIKVLQ